MLNNPFNSGEVAAGGRVNWFSVALALIATVMVYLFFATVPERNWQIAIQAMGTVAIAAGLYFACFSAKTEIQAGWRFIPFAILSIALPFVVEYFSRRQQLGSPWEVLVLIAFANLTAGLSVLSRFHRFQNLTAIFGGAAVFVVISMAESGRQANWLFTLLAVGFGLLVLWWSMSNYWQRLEQKFADQNTSQLPVRAIVFMISLMVVGLLAGVIAIVASTTNWQLPGISWFSGGEGLSDEFARDGVGQGDGIRGATEQAHTFGPVDSDVYLESNQPTFFDINSDFYGHPQRIRKSRAIALEGEMRTSENRVSRNQRAGSEFSVARKPRVSAGGFQDQLLSEVLFYLKGPRPQLLATETYNRLEDGIWFHQDPSPADEKVWYPNVPNDQVYRFAVLEPGFDRPWMRVSRSSDSLIFGGWDYSAVKIINLQTLRFPSPPMLEHFFIDKVDRPDFFIIGTDGIAQLNNQDSYLPPDTVIQQVHPRINLFRLQTNPALAEQQLASRLSEMKVFLEHAATSKSVIQLAQSWTANCSAQWDKVQRVVEHLRRDFRHDPHVLLPEGMEDAAQFLIENGSGTDYMFATAAALMFRSQGIPSRIVQGFLANPDRFDPQTGHTAVIGEDLHVWVEVSLDGVSWIPVEPTPGFPTPRYHLTLIQQATLLFYQTVAWVKQNPLLAILIVALLASLAYHYRWVLSGWHTLRWRLGSLLFPQRIVLNSANLIDRRGRLAGLPRPRSMTRAGFGQHLASLTDIDDADNEHLRRYTSILNQQLYHPASPPLSAAEIQQARVDCQNVVSQFRFQKLTKLRRAKNRL